MGAHGMDSERFETVVVGGGQAGLATGYHLARRGRPFVILDAGQRGRPLARALGLAAPVHPGRLQRSAGHGLPRPGLALPHQGRGGRLPGDLRGPVPAAGPAGGGRGRAHPAGRTVPGDRRGTPLRGRQRGRGLRRLPHPAGPRLRGRAGPGHPAAPLQRLPAPSQLREGPTLVVGAGNSGPRSPSSSPGPGGPGCRAGTRAASRPAPGAGWTGCSPRRSGSSSPGC